VRSLASLLNTASDLGFSADALLVFNDFARFKRWLRQIDLEMCPALRKSDQIR
jgi:hypothetical protein